MKSHLVGTSVLVTGGNSAIGRATSLRLAGLGAHVVLSGRDRSHGEELAEEIRRNGGRADFVVAGPRDEASARALAARARQLAGKIDVLVNNADAYTFGPTEDTTEDEFDAIVALNVKAPFFLVAELAPDMAKRGDGAIITVATTDSELETAGMGLYGSTKAAMVELTRSWAAEYGPRGVRVNAVSPGPSGTAGATDLGQAVSTSPAARAYTAANVAEAIAFLTEQGSIVPPGALLPVDGVQLVV
ncbi:SDR family NAD(P)-dependent oxidoreductase [Amycolatopsis sp. NPDC051903]|uniref:SDR family NAD(P)-dependent oxidoreductase n=1 Tax=Amycolatopsis sp. NPDC051903 TaxID=3363936 RepID=UPI00379F0C1C